MNDILISTGGGILAVLMMFAYLCRKSLKQWNHLDDMRQIASNKPQFTSPDHIQRLELKALKR